MDQFIGPPPKLLDLVALAGQHVGKKKKAVRIKKIVTKRWEAWENEGAFFYEPWISKWIDGKFVSYRYDRIPPKIWLEFLQDIKKELRIDNPHEARLLIDRVILLQGQAIRRRRSYKG